MKVPFVDLSRSKTSAIIADINFIITSSRFIGGEVVRQFEEEFATAMGYKFCASVNSGTDALAIAIESIVEEPGEIILPANTYIATAEAVIMAGHNPVFVDVNPNTYLIEPSLIENAITSRTRAVIPVHLYGQLCDMEAIGKIAENHNIDVIEDACQAHGVWRRYQSTSKAVCYSFFPSKPLGAYGDGGAIITNSSDICARAMSIRNHGQVTKSIHARMGRNSRLDTIQAVVLREKLKYLPTWNDQRKSAASLYYGSLTGVKFNSPVRDHVYHLFVVETNSRHQLRSFLTQEGIDTGVHYPYVIYEHPPFARFASRGSCPYAEKASRKILSLPIFSGIKDDEIQFVCEKIKEFYQNG